MRILLLLGFLLISILGLSQTKYPIQTIYKGDSVVVLSIKQSIDINKAIETQKRIIREQTRKIALLNKIVDSLKMAAGNSRVLDSIQYVADTTYKWADDLNLTIREMAMHGSFLYMLPPYNKVYFVNLDDYNLYSYDDGSVLVFEKMTKQEYAEYKKHREEHDKKFPSPVSYFSTLKFINFEGLLRSRERWIWKDKSLLEGSK
jgi:hypothetical protein